MVISPGSWVDTCPTISATGHQGFQKLTPNHPLKFDFSFLVLLYPFKIFSQPYFDPFWGTSIYGTPDINHDITSPLPKRRVSRVVSRLGRFEEEGILQLSSVAPELLSSPREAPKNQKWGVCSVFSCFLFGWFSAQQAID